MKKRFSAQQIAFALRQIGSGISVAEITRKMQISAVKRWCELAGGF